MLDLCFCSSWLPVCLLANLLYDSEFAEEKKQSKAGDVLVDMCECAFFYSGYPMSEELPQSCPDRGIGNETFGTGVCI